MTGGGSSGWPEDETCRQVEVYNPLVSLVTQVQQINAHRPSLD